MTTILPGAEIRDALYTHAGLITTNAAVRFAFNLYEAAVAFNTMVDFYAANFAEAVAEASAS